MRRSIALSTVAFQSGVWPPNKPMHPTGRNSRTITLTVINITEPDGRLLMAAADLIVMREG